MLESATGGTLTIKTVDDVSSSSKDAPQPEHASWWLQPGSTSGPDTRSRRIASARVASDIIQHEQFKTFGGKFDILDPLSKSPTSLAELRFVLDEQDMMNPIFIRSARAGLGLIHPSTHSRNPF